MRKKLLIYFLPLVLFTACESCSEEITNMNLYVQGKGGASVADVSYREAGKALNTLRNFTMDWFRNASKRGGAYLVCATNKSGVGTVKATIEVSLTKTCKSRWWDIDYDSETDDYDIYYESSETENYTTRKITAEDSDHICVSYSG